MTHLRAGWQAIRRALIAVGLVMGTINISILLSVVYLLFMPWMRLGFWLTKRDLLGTRRHARGGSTWVELEGSARAPTLEDFQNQF